MEGWRKCGLFCGLDFFERGIEVWWFGLGLGFGGGGFS